MKVVRRLKRSSFSEKVVKCINSNDDGFEITITATLRFTQAPNQPSLSVQASFASTLAIPVIALPLHFFCVASTPEVARDTGLLVLLWWSYAAEI